MGTIVEGELDQVLDLMRRCIERVAQHSDRVTCAAKLDLRRGPGGRIKTKWPVSTEARACCQKMKRLTADKSCRARMVLAESQRRQIDYSSATFTAELEFAMRIKS